MPNLMILVTVLSKLGSFFVSKDSKNKELKVALLPWVVVAYCFTVTTCAIQQDELTSQCVASLLGVLTLDSL
jgi:hypothetical protein